MGTWRQVLAYTFRRFFKMPGFVLAVIFSIGLGIAANSTIFAMVSRFVLRPAPVGDPSTLMNLRTTEPGGCCNGFPWPVYTDVRDQAKSFSGLAADFDLLPVSIGGGGEPERVWGQAATANYFDVAQLPMAIGRAFLRSEENAPVIILGHGLWQRRFGADPAIAGKSIIISGHPFTVVGVAPASFHSLDVILDPQFWVPLGNVEQLALNIPRRDDRSRNWLEVIGRLKPGVSKEQATAELIGLGQRIAAAHPEAGKELIPHVSTLRENFVDDVTRLLLKVMLAAVFFVLLIACGNVANLLLARAAVRQKEMAVRSALGASRRQIVRLLLAEALLLVLCGCALGLAIAYLGMAVFRDYAQNLKPPFWMTFQLDGVALLYTAGLAVVACLLAGLYPALRLSRPDLNSMINDAARGSTSHGLARFTRWMVIGEVALSCLLLVLSALTIRTVIKMHTAPLGFSTAGIYTGRIALPNVTPKLSETPGETRWLGPQLGEHTDDVLQSLGYEPEEIARLRESKAI